MKLSPSQIKYFCFSWFSASIRATKSRGKLLSPKSKRRINKEAWQQTNDFYTQVNTWEGIKELITNPLSLAWLLEFNERGIDFPRQRIELYKKITTTMLERGKEASGQPIFQEEIVMQRLGPLAFEMQTNDSAFFSFDKATELIRHSILAEGFTDIQSLDNEVKAFFKYLNFTCGILVRRAGSFYSFVYPCLQQYIAARYLRLVGEKSSEQEFENLIAKLFQSGIGWQEVLFLAITYSPEEGDSETKKIIKAVLSPNVNSGLEEPACVFAGTCLAENCLLLRDPDIEKLVAEKLFHVYEEGQKQSRGETCGQIAKLLYLWSKRLLENDNRSCPIWNILQGALKNEANQSRQLTCILLLIAIIKLPEFQSFADFEPLIPLLMALVGVSTAGSYQSDRSLKVSADQSMISSALTLLILIGENEPSYQLKEALERYIEVKSTAMATSDIRSQN